MRSHFFLRVVSGILLLLSFVTSALAGPPLICHRFEIGDARSLPWTGTAWNLSGNENYDTRNLVRDTLAILDSNPPVLVRMETLRRATLYAGKDAQAAKELLIRLHARTNGKQADALAWFDAGYLAATYSQWLKQNPAAGLDAYSLVQKALALRPNDPEMEFAAALITLRGPEKEHQEHAQKAIAGAKADALLAQNLASHFLGDEKQSVAEVLTRNTAWGKQ
ncbi:MAG TPA: hypothetical protein VI685_01260 [Candidatus Angelobacter sp.]